MFLNYMKYIIKHKWFVLIECMRLGATWRGILHDISKFLPSEFIPYMNYFYGEFPSMDGIMCDEKTINIKTKEIVDSEFNIAWLKHQNRNPHHWQYWILKKDSGEYITLDIPLQYRKEMLADWVGTGIVITGRNNIKEWYKENSKKMILHEKTREWIEEKINNFY